MSIFQVNGNPVLSGYIEENVRGAWVAVLDVDTQQDLTSECAISAFQDEFKWMGTKVSGLYTRGRESLLIQGGKAKLQSLIKAKSYKNITSSIVLKEIVSDCGEVIGALPSSQKVLKHYVRPYEMASHSLANACHFLGYNWRFRRDGKIWIDTDTYPAIEDEPFLVSEDASQSCKVYAPEKPIITAGSTYDSKKVQKVIYRITPEGFRAHVYYR